jgi:hypothetical protein
VQARRTHCQHRTTRGAPLIDVAAGGSLLTARPPSGQALTPSKPHKPTHVRFKTRHRAAIHIRHDDKRCHDGSGRRYWSQAAIGDSGGLTEARARRCCVVACTSRRRRPAPPWRATGAGGRAGHANRYVDWKLSTATRIGTCCLPQLSTLYRASSTGQDSCRCACRCDERNTASSSGSSGRSRILLEPCPPPWHLLILRLVPPAASPPPPPDWDRSEDQQKKPWALPRGRRAKHSISIQGPVLSHHVLVCSIASYTYSRYHILKIMTTFGERCRFRTYFTFLCVACSSTCHFLALLQAFKKEAY